MNMLNIKRVVLKKVKSFSHDTFLTCFVYINFTFFSFSFFFFFSSSCLLFVKWQSFCVYELFKVYCLNWFLPSFIISIFFSLDVDECSIDSAVCSNGVCANYMGGYQCSCFNGYKPNPSKTSCIGTDLYMS